MQRKKVQTEKKKLQPKFQLETKVSNRVGVICQMEYGKGFPTMKGFELDFKCFEDAVLELRERQVSPEEIDAARSKMVEYHEFGLPTDFEFVETAMLYISTRKLAEDALRNQKNRTIGFMVSINQVTGECRTEAMDYSDWEILKQQMETLCNKRFIYK